MRFLARDVALGIRRRELGVEIDEEVETDLVGGNLPEGVEVLVDVGELLGFDVQPAFLEEFARQAGREGLSEFEMSAWKCLGRAVPTGSLLDKDRITMDENSACPYEEFFSALRRSEHRVPPRGPDGARRLGRPIGPPRDTGPRTCTARSGGARRSSPRSPPGPATPPGRTKVSRPPKRP